MLLPPATMGWDWERGGRLGPFLPLCWFEKVRGAAVDRSIAGVCSRMPGQGQWDEGRGGSNGLGRTPCTTESTITEAISAKRASMPVIKSVLTFLDYHAFRNSCEIFPVWTFGIFLDIGRHSRLVTLLSCFSEKLLFILHCAFYCNLS